MPFAYFAASFGVRLCGGGLCGGFWWYFQTLNGIKTQQTTVKMQFSSATKERPKQGHAEQYQRKSD